MASNAHENEQTPAPDASGVVGDGEEQKIYGPPEDREPKVYAENGPIHNLREKEPADVDDNDDDEYFEAAEHEATTYGVTLRNIFGIRYPATDHECWSVKVSDKKNITLTFGRIIALAGDFYSSHLDSNRAPICGAFFSENEDISSPQGFYSATNRFKSAVQSLKQDMDQMLSGLTRLLDKETQGVDEAERRAEKLDPNDPIHTIANAYHDHACGIPTNIDVITATMSRDFWASLYGWLSFLNADHFDKDALIAYTVGHSVAMQLARDAGKRATEEEKANLLQDAYIHEAFALHYLTDLFSSGHLRLARREMHNSSDSRGYSEQVQAAVVPGAEIPIWDFQANYMHDNDCNTGLLVQNQIGQQWLCYGDKQFKESWDIVNRARLMQCIQASIDEIYDDGFVRQLNKNRDDFNAVKFIPRPMIAAGEGPSKALGPQWGGHDVHNPAPLWQVNTEGNKNAWTLRANVNDHSVFERRGASPSPTGTIPVLGIPQANQECKDVRDSSFRKQGSAPTARPITGLTTGGFMQIQDFKINGDAFSCINFWGPVAVGIYDRAGKQGDHTTFTLRNRITRLDGQSNSGTMIHCAKWHDSDGMDMYRLYASQQGDKQNIFISGWRINENSTTPGEPVKFDADKPWTFEPNPQFQVIKLAELASPFEHPNLVRLISGNFTDPNHADIAFLKFNVSSAVEATILGRDGSQKRKTAIEGVNGVPNFVKKAKLDGIDHIVLTSFGEADNGFTNLDIEAIDISGQSPRVLDRYHEQVYTARDSSITRSTLISQPSTTWSFRVGDLNKTGKDQILVLFDGQKELVVSITELAPTRFQRIDLIRIPQTLQAKNTVKPCFNALVPTENPDASSNLSILQVSLSTSYSWFGTPTTSLIFRLTDTLTWATKTSNPIKDTLVENPHYFNIKWIRCSRTSELGFTTSNALLEVFSLYGVLGIRLFAPTSENELVEYQEIGRLQYMGQTSNGAGLGTTGDWGNGILNWGLNETDFIDVDFLNPPVSATIRNGGFEMLPTDVQRPLIGGWEVTKRPGYTA